MTDDKQRQNNMTDQSDLQEEQGGKGGTSEATQEQTDFNQGNVSDESTTLDFESDVEQTDESSTGESSSGGQAY